MRESLKRFWDKIKWGLFLIIYTAGVIGWMYFYQEFKIIRCEANWAYEKAIQLEQKVEIKDDVSMVPAIDPITPAEEREVDKIASPPSGIEQKILDKFGSDGKVALAVFKAESNLNPSAVGHNTNGTKDLGLAQINTCHCKRIGDDCEKKLLDPEFNIEFAYDLYQRSNGFGPWVAYKNNRHLKYL